MPEIIDHQTEGLSLIIQQYKKSLKFIAVLNALNKINNEFENILQEFQTVQLDIDTASCEFLNNIGRIVGVDRTISNSIPNAFFNFLDGINPIGFSEEGGSETYENGFYEEGGNIFLDTELNDDLYRLFIYAKALKNNSKCTIEDLIKSLALMLPNSTRNIVNDNLNMSIGICIGTELTFFEKRVLIDYDLIPRAGGVRINFLGNFNSSDGFLGFEGQQGAKPFSEEGELPNTFLVEEIF